jgi:aminoglycoside phosphotransferase (APT) family kinase protein
MAAGEPPGELIGVGRSADVYAIGTDRVLRRFRGEYDMQAEADIMIYLGQAGFPVPAVYDVSGRDLVMERLDGRDMLADLGRRPWRGRPYGRMLADLHNRLHQIQAPPELRQLSGSGDRVLHLDFHPGNVMLTARGPVVIDWTNASAGAPGEDVAMAYLILASSEVDDVPRLVRPAVMGVRSALIAAFLAGVQGDPGPHIGAIAERRMSDRNVRPAEIARLRQLAEQASERAS